MFRAAQYGGAAQPRARDKRASRVMADRVFWPTLTPPALPRRQRLSLLLPTKFTPLPVGCSDAKVIAAINAVDICGPAINRLGRFIGNLVVVGFNHGPQLYRLASRVGHNFFRQIGALG